MPTPNVNLRGSRGFSLVEVVIALGLIGGVLVAVAGMFVLGSRQVASGRSSTEALSVGRAIVEELEGLGFRQVYGVFAAAGCAPDSDDRCTVDSRGNAYAARWQRILDDSLSDSRAEVTFESIDGLSLDATRGYRVRVAIFWTEGDRPRSLALATVRL